MSLTDSLPSLAEKVWAIPGVPQALWSYITPFHCVHRFALLSRDTFEHFLAIYGNTIDLKRYQDLTYMPIHLVGILNLHLLVW
jgi:hypothetical protein